MAGDLARHAAADNDPLWRMPLWTPYYALIESSVAELNNAGESGFAGSVTAALFLKRFVERAKSYVHFDIFAWTPMAKPGRPKGGEAQAIHALFACHIRALRQIACSPSAPWSRMKRIRNDRSIQRWVQVS